jgi:ankyrin repeat protein
MSYLFYGINSAIRYARDGYTKELSDFLSKKPHLINQKNKNGNSILHIACWKGDTEMVLMLLMRGSNVNSIDSKGYSPLLVAIEFCHHDLALSLLERGADISIGNQAYCMPLHVAALSGCKNIVIPLLQRGADINAIETVSFSFFPGNSAASFNVFYLTFVELCVPSLRSSRMDALLCFVR